MNEMSNEMKDKPGIGRYAPITAIACVAVLGAIFLRDYLSFDALQENREALIAFRDANYLGTVLASSRPTSSSWPFPCPARLSRR